MENLHSNLQRQIFLTKLIQKTCINPDNLPRNKNDRISLHFDSLLSNLNTILLGQYLQKSQMSISKQDLNLLQRSDKHLNSIMINILHSDQPLANTKFNIKDGVLFKNSKVYDETIPRLCLPKNIGREILFKIHNLNNCHISGTNLLTQFNANFYSE